MSRTRHSFWSSGEEDLPGEADTERAGSSVRSTASHARGDTHSPVMRGVRFTFVGGLARFHFDFSCAAVTGGDGSEVFNFTNSKYIFTKVVNHLLSHNVTVTL